MSKKTVLKASVFLLAFVVVFQYISRLMIDSDSDFHTYQRIDGFFNERDNSLDAVYIGGSVVHTYWVAPVAWERYGMTVYPFSCSEHPLAAAEYWIKDARKTQPNALYIINTDTIGTDFSESVIHKVSDFFRPSVNKLQMINRLLELSGYSKTESLEFFFPILRYHSHWPKLSEINFEHELNGLKGGRINSGYLSASADFSENLCSTTRRLELDARLQEVLESLLAYCDSENINALFVNAPRMIGDEARLAQYNMA